MDDAEVFQRVTGVTAVLSALLAFASAGLLGAAINFSPQAFLNPAASLGLLTPGSEHLIRWGMLCDILGYYLLLAPLALYLHRWLGPKSPHLFPLYTLAGLAYLLIGAIGAATLAAVLPPLVQSAGQASGVQRETLTIALQIVANGVVVGLWNTLEVILAGVWWLGVGRHLRPERPALGSATIVLGSAALLDAAGVWLGIPLLAALGLNVMLLLAPIWALWIGIDILRQRDVMHHA